MQTLFPGVHLIEAEYRGRPQNMPLLVGSWGAMLVDTGTREAADGKVLPALAEAAGPDRLRWVVDTHCDLDHIGGNAAAKRAAPGAMLACGTADRETIEDVDRLVRERYDAWRTDHGVAFPEERLARMREECGEARPVDVTFSGGERVRLDAGWLVEVIHLPGHSRGHIGILDHRHRALYAGDAIHGAFYPGVDGAPKLPPTYLEVDQYLDTIRTVLALARGGAVTTYVGSHWPVLRGEEQIAAFCEQARKFCMHAEQLVLAEVRRGEDVRLAELMDRLGPQLGSWPREEDDHLCFALAGHLDLLERRGAIRSSRKGQIKVYGA